MKFFDPDDSKTFHAAVTVSCLIVMQGILLSNTAEAALKANTLTRDRDPVVLTGDQLPDFIGLAVDRIVGFRYESGWVQIPIQIDERKMVDFGVVYDVDPVGILTLSHTDPNTYVGADSDPSFDSNDELVFMAPDAGNLAAGAVPEHVVSDSGLEIEIFDSLDGGMGYVYLFESDGTVLPDAGQDYIHYTFDLLAGDYIPDYNLQNGPNPEDSEAWSEAYRTHFSDRWIRDEVHIYEGGSGGEDILDRHKNMFGPGNCSRTEDTFSGGEGAFFINKDGAVRAIRSYMGANSGPFTQREHLFYAQRQDVTTFLRVHAISGVMDVYDYSPEASGMTYYNDLNTGGVPVDGMPDTVTAGEILWEMVTGAQGSLLIAEFFETDIVPFAYTLYYSDDATPFVTQCTGDDFEYATSGPWVNQAIPNTDPYLGSHHILNARRIIYYESPDQTVASAEQRYLQADTPLDIAVDVYDPVPAPELTNPSVSPAFGYYGTRFEYLVDYDHPAGDPPAVIQVFIDDMPFDMTLDSGTASSGTYRYRTRDIPQDTPHTYYFFAEDSLGESSRSPASGYFDGPATYDPELVLTGIPGAGAWMTVEVWGAVQSLWGVAWSRYDGPFYLPASGLTYDVGPGDLHLVKKIAQEPLYLDSFGYGVKDFQLPQHVSSGIKYIQGTTKRNAFWAKTNQETFVVP
jgi:hypothetical protein